MRTETQILGFLLSVIGAVFCACPSGWKQHDKYGCYLIVNEKKTWPEANNDCSIRYRSGHLLYMLYSYHYYQKYHWLNLTQSGKYFIGARKNASGWFWANGKQLSKGFLFLRKYYSSLSGGTYLVAEYNVINSYSYLKLRGVDGSSKYKYICAVEEGLVHSSAFDSSSVVMKGTTSASGLFISANLLSTPVLSSSTPNLSPSSPWATTAASTASSRTPQLSVFSTSSSLVNAQTQSMTPSHLSSLLTSSTYMVTQSSVALKILSSSSSSPPYSSSFSFSLTSMVVSSSIIKVSSTPPPQSSSSSPQSPSSSFSSTYLTSSSSSSSSSSIAKVSLPQFSSFIATVIRPQSSSLFYNLYFLSSSSSSPPLLSSLSSSNMVTSSSVVTVSSCRSSPSSCKSSSPSILSLILSSSLTSKPSSPNTILLSSKLPTRTVTQKIWTTGTVYRSSSMSIKSLVSNIDNRLVLASSLNTLSTIRTTLTPFLNTTNSIKQWPTSTPALSGLKLDTRSTEARPTSSVPSVTREKVTRQNSIDSFMYNITQLDPKEYSSLNRSLAMMESFLSSLRATDSSPDLTDQNPLAASKHLEDFAFRYIAYHWNGSGFHFNRENIVLQAEKLFPGHGNYMFKLQETDNEDSTITVPKENFESRGTFILSIGYKNLHGLMNAQSYNLENDSFRYKLNSRIISVSTKPKRQTLENNVTMVFKISTQDSAFAEHEKECVFWRFPSEQQEGGGWSRDGCMVIKTTGGRVNCSCNHLTHFAVLMQVKNKISRDQDAILTILTNVGLGLSIVGCVITFFAYRFFTESKSEQSQIRMNLVFVLAVAHILFLLGNPAKCNLVVCVVVAVLLQLFYTSALCWMFAEGIQLYMQIIKVFNTNLKMRQVYGFAYGFPLLLITVSLSIAGNGSGGLASFVGNDFCWLSVENHLIWTFVAPVLLLILVNLVVLGMVVKEMSRINQSVGETHGDISLRSSIKALIILAPLLGVTWLTGLLCILGADIVGLYIFTIFNSTQGFLIFVFHCWRNSEIQGKFRRKVQALEGNLSKHDDAFHAQNYVPKTNVKKAAFTRKPTISTRPKPRKHSPGCLTMSDFDASAFEDAVFKRSKKV